MSGVSTNESIEYSGELGDALALVRKEWEDCREIYDLIAKMDVLGRNLIILRGSGDPEDRKKARLVWQKASQIFWELVWAIIEAKIDAGPPDALLFSPGERLIIDFGHLHPGYTTFTPHITEHLSSSFSADMYQYGRLTDFVAESYSLIFGREEKEPKDGAGHLAKRANFERELASAASRRRMAAGVLHSVFNLIAKADLDVLMEKLEHGLADAVEAEMRTRRVREAAGRARDVIHENAACFESAEKEFMALLEAARRRITGASEASVIRAPAEVSGSAPAAAVEKEAVFDPFEDLAAARFSPPQTGLRPEDDNCAAGGEQETSDIEEVQEAPAGKAKEDAIHSLRAVGNIMTLHERTKFLAGLIVHAGNESERRKTRFASARSKYGGQGLPALKMELRNALNNKREFMGLAAKTGRTDVSPLCSSQGKPITMSCADKIMMDLTPLDPGMLRVSRIRMYGIPRVILTPGGGLGVYDWQDNSLIIPIFPTTSDIKSFCYALAAFRWDNDDDSVLKDSYTLLKDNKRKGVRALQESFYGDYFLWISKERKGYRVLPGEISKWFKVYFTPKRSDAARFC